MGEVFKKLVQKNGTMTEWAIVRCGFDRYEVQRTDAYGDTIDGPKLVATLKTEHGAKSKLAQLTK